MTGPTQKQAVAAVADVDTARADVTADTWRGLPLTLAATSALTFLDFALKDRIRSRRGRVAATVVNQAAIAGTSLLGIRTQRVNPFTVASAPDHETGARLAALSLGWYAAERLAVRAIRRSRLRRPNTVAGAVLAVSRPAGTLAVLRALPRAGSRA